jgi:Glycosyl transferases group 1
MQEVLYKLQALHAQGVKIHLHCFDYGRGRQPMLLNWCETIEYYERAEGPKGLRLGLPYIVASRANEKLLHNLLQDDYPILMEGVHSTYWLKDERIAKRKIIVRLHNVECTYYKQLQKAERNFFKKIYFLNESRLLQQYEKWIASTNVFLLAISAKDEAVYKEKFAAKKIAYLPVFTGWAEVKSKEGIGNFCLYHGNLSVPENEAVANWLLQNVFSHLPIPFVIAGKNPSAKLEDLAHAHKHTCIVANPSEHEMQDLITKAQISILPSFNSTGVKLKLINALYNGRHCIVNDAAVEGTGVAALTHQTNDAQSMQQMVQELYEKPFATNDLDERKKILAQHFDNARNAKKLIALFTQL